MESFIKSLSIEQLENIKSIIHLELDKKISESEIHTIEMYRNYPEKELKKIKRAYKKQMLGAKSNRVFDKIDFQIKCIDIVLNSLK